jgi:hypothetical protein
MPSGPWIPHGPRHHHGTQRPTTRRYQNGQTESSIRTNTGGADEGGTVNTAHQGGTDGGQQPTTDHRPTTTDHSPADEAISAPKM